MPITIYGETNPDHARFNLRRDTFVWRYMDIAKYLDLITKGKLWFTRVIEFRHNDPYEAGLTEHDEQKTVDIVEARTKEELRSILNRYQEIGIADLMDRTPEKSVYWFQLIYLTRLPYTEMNAYTHSVSCWHENQTESDAMWALYAHRDAGIAIKSTASRILAAFEKTQRTMSIAKVTYDSSGALSALTSGIFDSILIKRHAFHHEQEVRIVAITMDGYEASNWTQENQTYNVDSSRSVAPGIYIDCDLNSLIEEVVISPLMKSHGAEAIIDISKKILPNVPIRQSTLLTKGGMSFALTKELTMMLNEYRRTRLLRDISEISR
jgi:hypothetical protein